MKVLHIINSLCTGGAEKLIVDSLPLYIESGVNVDLFLLNVDRTPFYLELEKKFLGNIFYSKFSSIYNPYQIFEIRKRLFDYDLVHVHLFPSQYWVVFAKILSFSSVKLVFTEHSTSNKRIQNKIFQPIERFIYSYYSRVICITSQVRDVLLEHLHCKENKLVVIENGVKTINYANALALSRNMISDSILETDTLLIMVAAFRREKDHETLLRALTLLPENVKLLLVGDGEMRNEIERSVSSKHLIDRVFLLGVRMDVPQLLKLADIAILSSHWEGFGLVAVEGMASGLPFIASDVPGLADVVRGAGLLFKVGDENDLTSKILSLIDNDEYSLQVAQQCENRAKMYDVSLMIDRTIALYNKILKNSDMVTDCK